MGLLRTGNDKSENVTREATPARAARRSSPVARPKVQPGQDWARRTRLKEMGSSRMSFPKGGREEGLRRTGLGPRVWGRPASTTTGSS